MKELFWLAPFAFLGLIALAPLRLAPTFPASAQNRVMIDAEGVKVAIPLPFRAVLGSGPSDFLEISHAPEVILEAGRSGTRRSFASGLMSRIYR